ncbi:NADP oxidoreductase [Candidatus Roizmanbacteria bacterium RIFCSPHIGHO2_01_FULL_39_8]|uniref:NADP oxidoreductase n=2 Tax=Candidatus Roizmaniibacteriota TaxID=1752723 RepID=A0A1F7GPT1_9BACT|nr:MAG: NADP oxidoreductase [Candidatus Roizmanbacteria bacterium RIFCSPHIGHO2_01_FULL_39_8]OGK26032.1 MAG: NADP oxidoreductase [Candidatus Roizmanbacteria bacterium RIFCSPHIGHO2_02_FULL_39_9]
MKIAVLGTGMVGRAHAAKLAELGHEVTIGTRDVAKTTSETKPDQMGNPPFSQWQKEHSHVKLETFENAVKNTDMILEALHGAVAVEVLKALESSLTGKILIDIANPLDFSKGMPPSLFVSNTDSLGEQIQNTLPKTRVVKTFNTMNAMLQINPQMLANGEHHIFTSGNDADAKGKVTELLTSYGWKHIIDLGDITTARGTEMMMPFWLRLWGSLKTPMFNYRIVTK